MPVQKESIRFLPPLKLSDFYTSDVQDAIVSYITAFLTMQFVLMCWRYGMFQSPREAGNICQVSAVYRR